MRFAHWLMKFALVTAPDNRAEWAHAMFAEFAALDDRNANRFAWAAGCVGTALAWRLRASAPYLVALAALPILWNTLIASLIFQASTTYAFSRPISQEEMGSLWLAVDGAGTQFTLFLMSAVLCVYQPRHSLISVMVLWLATTGVSFLSMFGPEFAPLVLNAPFSSENNHPALPNVVMALTFSGADMWPTVVGGFAGWAFARGKRGAVVASAVLALALIVGFADFFINPGQTNEAYTIFTMTSYTITSAALMVAIVLFSVTAMRGLRRVWQAAG